MVHLCFAGALPILGLTGTLQNNGLITWDGTNDGLLAGTGTIVNACTFTKSTPANALLGVAFTNQTQGTLNVKAGSLTLGGGSPAAGTLNVRPDATLGFGGTFTIDISITTVGTIDFLSGTVTDMNTLSAATLNLYGGTLTFESPVTADNGAFDAGTLAGCGPFTITDESVRFVCELHAWLGVEIYEPGDAMYFSPENLAKADLEF